MYTAKPMVVKADDLMETNINEAIKKGFFQQIRFLIAYGAKVNELDSENRTPLMNCALIDDTAWGVGLAKLLLEKGATVAKKDVRGMNAMHYACIYERPLLVETYLRALDFNLNAPDRYGNTALHYACGEGNVVITSMLVKAMARYGLSLRRKNREGDTPAILAAKNGCSQCKEAVVNALNQEVIQTKQNEEISEKKDSVGVITLDDGRQDFNKMRPRTAFANLHNVNNSLSVRRGSEPPRLRSAGGRRFVNLFNQENPPQTLYEKATEQKRLTAQFYRPASVLDKRNKPEYFNDSPLRHFAEKQKYPTPGNPSAVTAHPVGILQRAKSEDYINGSWRDALWAYLNRYNYQFSSSYLKAAVPIEPDPTEPGEDEEKEDGATEAPVEEVEPESTPTKKGALKKSLEKDVPRQKGKLDIGDLSGKVSRIERIKSARPSAQKRNASTSSKRQS